MKLSLVFFSLFLLVSPILGQKPAYFKISDPVGSSAPPTNSVSNMAPSDSGILTGTGKGLYQYRNHQFLKMETGEPLLDQYGVYSVASSGKYSFFATGEIREKGGSDVTAGLAYGYSSDFLKTWNKLTLPLDQSDDDSIFFGQDTILALPIVVPEQFVTYDAEVSGDTIWVATWSGGIRQSSDGGITWQRTLLPPDDRNYISPDSSYWFFYSPVSRDIPQKDGGDLNFLGFSVHKTASGVLWAGTAGGINRRYSPESWQKFTWSPVPGSLPGNWVVGIQSQKVGLTERVWAICWRANGADESYALAFTDDQGKTWTTTLKDEKIYDLAIHDKLIVAAGENGVYYSENGTSWGFRSSFRDEENKQIIPFSGYYSAVWNEQDQNWMIGSSQGLLISSTDNPFSSGTWQILRKEVREGTNEAFAYPNPFSPDDDRVCRFSFPMDSQVKVKIFSNDQLLVRELSPEFSGSVKEVLWDGRDHFGNRLSNGVYLYHIETSGKDFWGKILILE